MNGIEYSQFRGSEKSVMAYEFVVQVNVSASGLFRLDADHVPVDSGLVAVVRHMVGLSRRQVEGAGYLFVKRMFRIGLVMAGLTPKANSPSRRAPGSVSRMALSCGVLSPASA